MAAAAGEERKKTACVTGGTGRALILNCVPEDKEANSHLEDLKKLGTLEVFRADLGEEGSYDEAVAGCDYAFLLAAPKELIELGVQGTLNVMRSCVKAGTVKRVILTSSTAAVSSRSLEGDGHVLDEESFSDVEYLLAKRTGLWAYSVSKVLLEKAASRFAAEHGISLVTLCPSVTVGEAPDRQAELNVLRGIERASGSVPLVHVRDVCRDEIFAAEAEAAAGRYICNGLDTTILEISRFLAGKYPQYDVNTDISGDLLAKPVALLPSTKLEKEGVRVRVQDAGAHLQRHGGVRQGPGDPAQLIPCVLGSAIYQYPRKISPCACFLSRQNAK
ncbi:hypothetical protein PAHAL_7G302800 [Panicum hallii]|uniref:NAD-dependent epimerase/dehydratase domain-containing protein n=1 Tax=Panicum hallii TaxID=206008 RepID=A0A2T8IDY9_9POAL|nr:hypothetical protein PAHAL_7G302800 [Panicum hallii]